MELLQVKVTRVVQDLPEGTTWRKAVSRGLSEDFPHYSEGQGQKQRTGRWRVPGALPMPVRRYCRVERQPVTMRDGDVLDMLVTKRRDKRAAKRFFRKVLKGQGEAPMAADH